MPPGKTPSGRPWTPPVSPENHDEDVSRVRARALRTLGQPPQATPLPQSPREVLQLAERVMTAPCWQGCLFQPLALVRDIGFNCVKLLNPRTKWVGESERNFFKALQSLRTLTPLAGVEDKADQSEHGRDEYSGDTGVSNRLRQMRFVPDRVWAWAGGGGDGGGSLSAGFSRFDLSPL